MLKKKTPKTSEKEKKIIEEETLKHIAELEKIFPDLIFLGGKDKGRSLSSAVITRGELTNQAYLLAELLKQNKRLCLLTLILLDSDE